MLSHFLRAVPKGPTSINLVYRGYAGNNAVTGATATYTYSAAAIGDASAYRVVLVALAYSNGHVPSAVTIGGVSATGVTYVSGSIGTSIWYASVPSGTTADIVFTKQASGSNNFNFTWYTLTSNYSTPYDTASSAEGTGTRSVTIDSYGGGAMIYVVSTRSDSTINTATWTGTSTFTEDANLVFSGSSRYGATGSSSIGASDTVTNGTLTVGGLADTAQLIAVSWRP